MRLDTLITTQNLNLETLLCADSTFYGDLFPHVVKWGGELYRRRRTAHCVTPCTAVPSCTRAY